ncbi:MAG: AAA family ATPase [Flavobacteriales bacterium]
MIPIRLILEGIYSYKEKQEIDFRQLTEAGLFGIFGAVGSGKSSILEAIIIALFGDPERLSPKGERGSLINLQSQRLYIEFEFSVGTGENSRYLSRYELKRNKKDFQSVGTPERTFYRFEDGQWGALSISDASEILGMKAEDFKRTIIIPQGKFKEFVELKDKDRTAMLSDLFHLDRFDLTGPVKTLLDKNHDDVLRLETHIATIGDVSPERKTQLEKDIEDQAKAIHEHQEGMVLVEKELAQLNALKTFHEEWIDVNGKLQALEKQRPQIEERRARLNQYRRAVEFFKVDLERLDVLDKRLTEVHKKIKDLEEGTEQRTITESDLKTNRDKWFEEVSKKDEKQRRVDLLQKLIDMKRDQQKLDTVKADLEEEQKRLQALEKTLNDGQELLSSKMEALKSVEGQLPDSATLLRWGAVLAEWKSLNQQLAQHESRWSDLNKKQREIQKEIEEIDGRWLEVEFPEYHLVRQRLENALLAVDARREQEKLRLGLSAFAAHVVPGEPCPLCGATDHPEIVHISDQGVLLQIQQEESVLKETWQRFTKDELMRSSKVEELANGTKELQKLSDQITEIKDCIEKIIRSTEEKGWKTVADLDMQLEEWKKLALDREQLNKAIGDLRLQKEKAESELNQHKEQSREKENALSLLNARVGQLLQEIELEKDRWWEKYLETDVDQISSDQEKVKAYLAGLNAKYEEAQRAFETFQKEKVSMETTLQQLREERFQNTEELKKVQDSFQQKLTESSFQHIEEIRTLLLSGIDSQREAGEIEAFEREFVVIAGKHDELTLKLGNAPFVAEHYATLQETLIQAKEQGDMLKEAMGALNGQLKHLEDQAKLKDELSETYRKAVDRRSLLKELDGLFKGKGFVSYISNFYLRDLCAAANKRFTKLTRNQLSLEVDEDNVFYVKDYLNEGRLRLLKTLSGGQTFQASLCLALALAERVKVLNQSEKSFFFLDEGFGSLDKDALAVVLDTLKTLRRENRIVGIISHVEELQQEMDLSLRVVLDKEKGSHVFIQ